MTLHMLQAQPDMAGVMRWAGMQGLLMARGTDDLGYTLHALLAANFGSLAPKPFALVEHPRQAPALLAYAAHDAAALREHAACFAMPDAVAALRIASLLSKPMPAGFAVGQRLGFGVRVRPIVRTDRDGDRTRTREVDAFLAAVAGAPQGAGPDRGSVYRAWVLRHLEQGGVVVESLEIKSFQLGCVLRRTQDRSLRPQSGPDVRFVGTIRVADPDLFAAMLARGVGRHRAFGFGMLLLRPC